MSKNHRFLDHGMWIWDAKDSFQSSGSQYISWAWQASAFENVTYTNADACHAQEMYRTASPQDHPIESKVCGIDDITLILSQRNLIQNIKYFVKVLEVYFRFLQMHQK